LLRVPPVTPGIIWFAVFGPAVVIWKGAPLLNGALDTVRVPGSATAVVLRAPASRVIDAFEALQNATSNTYKRVPTALDNGFIFDPNGTYTARSARRKVAAVIGGRRVLQDSNNSGNDFEIVTPTPRGFGSGGRPAPAPIHAVPVLRGRRSEQTGEPSLR
jgi:hypothetical protein